MSRPRWVAFVALLGAFMLAAAGCANNDNGGGGGGGQAADCNADQFGCLTVGSGEPIKIGTLLSITGDNRSLGVDSQRGVVLAVDNLDGKLDGKPGQLMGHNIELVNTDETCSKAGGQAGARPTSRPAWCCRWPGTTPWPSATRPALPPAAAR